MLLSIHAGDMPASKKIKTGIASYTFELSTEFFEVCSYFQNSIMPGNMTALLYAIKVVRTPYMTPAGPEAINLALDFGSSVPSGTIVTISTTMDDTCYNNNNGKSHRKT